MADELVQIPVRSIGSIIGSYIYYASLWIIPLAIILFFLYKVFRKEEFSNKKSGG
jgi:ABC-type multidrug transport system permease subunit